MVRVVWVEDWGFYSGLFFIGGSRGMVALVQRVGSEGWRQSPAQGVFPVVMELDGGWAR